MEEMKRSLDQMRLRCLILEADKDAEMVVKDAEKSRASRYRSILSKLVGEEDIGADAANRPQTSGLHLMSWDGSAHSTSPALSSYFARSRLAVTEPQPQPAATVTELRAPIEVACSASSTGTRTSPPNNRNLNSASHGESESDQGVVTRARSSRSTQQTARSVHVSRMTDGQRSSGQRNVRVPSSSGSSRGTRVSINGTPLAEMFTRAGVSSFELTRDEVVRTNETQGIPWSTFTKKFGGHWRAEWPKCDLLPGYNNFLCVDTNVQPFVPTAPGKPGLVLRLPTMGLTPRDDGDTFHVFLSHHTLLYYQGDYTRSHLLQVQFDDWNHLPHDYKDTWLKRITGSRSNSVVCRALRARIILRNKFKREPHLTEVLEYLMSGSSHTLPYRVASAAFRAGEEKLVCEAIQCIAYDSNLATIIQRNA